MKNKVCTADVQFPEDFDEQAKEFITKCLTVDPFKRIGGEYGNLETEIFKLGFFSDHLNTETIHYQTPPVSEEVVQIINEDVMKRTQFV